jgi:heme exporter protein A
MTSETVLEARNLWCVYNDRLIFSNLSFALQSSQCLCIQGPNGSGKSSLLQILAGFMRPYMGTIIRDDSVNLRMVTQPDGLTSDLTVQETEDYWAELFGEAPVCIFSLSQHMDSLVSTLSRGEMQKLALNKLHHDHSKLWILDEPFTALDAHSSKALGVAMRHQLDRGGSIIFTSHESLKLPFKTDHTLKLGAPC